MIQTYQILLLASIAVNVATAVWVWRARKKRPLARDAQELLSELSRGKAVVEIKVLDTDLLFTWKPHV